MIDWNLYISGIIPGNLNINGAPSGGLDITLQDLFDRAVRYSLIKQYNHPEQSTGVTTEKSNFPKMANAAALIGNTIANHIGAKTPSSAGKVKSPNIPDVTQNIPFMNTKAGKFSGTYGNTIGNITSMLGDFVGKRGLDGEYGNITLGMDAAYDVAQKVAGQFGPVGQLISGIMGVNKLVGNVASKIGGGTDGMTKTDAVLNSSFLTPLGLINGFGGKKADTYTRNNELDAATNGGFQGFLATEDFTSKGAGKKYGLFSSGARKAQNRLTEYTLNMKHTVSSVVDTNTINSLAAQGSTPFIGLQQGMDLSGGIQLVLAAKHGTKLAQHGLKVKNMKFKGVKNLTPKPYGPEGMLQLYDKEGNPTRGLTTYQEKGWEPVTGYDGKPRYIGYKQNPGLPYLLKQARHGMLFCKRVVSKYLIGNKLKRTFQTIDTTTGKLVEIPLNLTKDQIAGREPIKLADGTVVFMAGDGTVGSGYWETGGEREHLTPKGLDGMKTKRKPRSMNILIPYANGWMPPFIKRIWDNDTRSIPMPDGTVATHLLSYGESDGKYYVFPEIQDINGELQRIPGTKGLKSALKNHNVLEMLSAEEAELFTKLYKDWYPQFFLQFKQGGKMNVIPEGALHARLHHLDLVMPDEASKFTNKGIPVITVEEGGEIVQHAEIEHSEIIFTKEVTDKIEDLRKKWHESKDSEYCIEAGKLLVEEILYNTDDRTNLIESIE